MEKEREENKTNVIHWKFENVERGEKRKKSGAEMFPYMDHFNVFIGNGAD